MSEVYLAQALNRPPEVVGQRVIISETESESPDQGLGESIIPSNFFYALFAILLFILAIWAIKQYTKRPTLRAPVAVVPTNKVK